MQAVCPICGPARTRARLVSWVDGEPHTYRRCVRCGLWIDDPARYVTYDPSEFRVEDARDSNRQREFRRSFIEGMDISSDSGALYPDYDFVDESEMSEGLFHRVDRHVRAHLGSTAALRVLEIGAATGFLLRTIQRAYPDAEATGIDPSPVAVKRAADLGTTVLHGTMETVDLNDRLFDVIIAFGNLMLHADPLSTLVRARRCLDPNGIIVFDVKNVRTTARLLGRAVTAIPVIRSTAAARELTSRSFTNFRFGFGKTQARLLAERAGLDVLTCRTEPPRALAYENRHPGSSGLRGRIWRVTDRLDGWRDERAWIEFVCRPVRGKASRPMGLDKWSTRT